MRKTIWLQIISVRVCVCKRFRVREVAPLVSPLLAPLFPHLCQAEVVIQGLTPGFLACFSTAPLYVLAILNLAAQKERLGNLQKALINILCKLKLDSLLSLSNFPGRSMSGREITTFACLFII